MATIASRDPIAPRHPLQADPEEALAALDTVREQTLVLVGHLGDDELSRVLSPIMSPLVWDLAHIAAYEDLWLAHRHGGLELLRPDLAEMYDAFETPRALRGEIELLDPEQARAYLRDVRARSAKALAERGVGDGVIYELVLRHELQHSETMRQTMALAGMLPAGEPPLSALAEAQRAGSGNTSRGDAPMEDWVQVAAGCFEMGAQPDGFAYDNERPRHARELPAFEIARFPVSNASWMSFSEGGGYERREWWSQEGWAWKLKESVVPPAGVESGHPDAPVCHVSWFEAEAFARASGARLPSEAEWEKAARDLGDTPRGRLGARLENGKTGAQAGGLEGVGYVWEWTSSRFEGYPGFVAHPYREYSEVFFGGDYRVLRGGSWATSPRVGTVTFRNWDHPIRRQIFAGVRLARDMS
ncbi:MAG: SUMF1/EgtB/PvdO family nonheme iron enzyme [Solirubrobacteraceae bacterium]